VLLGQLVLTFPPGQNESTEHMAHSSPSAPTYPGVHTDKYIFTTSMFTSSSATLRFSGVTADSTYNNSSGVTMIVVSTAMVCNSRRRPSVFSRTEVISITESETFNVLATADTYATRTTGVNASTPMKSVAVNAIDTSSHSPPGGPM
jgi:hypothetical protein